MHAYIYIYVYINLFFLEELLLLIFQVVSINMDFPGGSDGKASAYNAEDPGSIPGWEDPLEKEMATHSSTLAWKIPWTEECYRLQSKGSQRVGNN